MQHAVEVTGLVKRYGATTAVNGLTFRAPAGQVTAVLGPNGAGKTSTIECCEGFRRPDGGTVRVLGEDPQRADRRWRARVGVMLQDGGIYPTARPIEMLRHVASLHRDPASPDALAERLGLTPHAGTPYKRLSGGQQRRLALALAVVGRPELVFLDEPTAGLDPQARRATWDLVDELRREGVTVVLSTHHMDEAQRLADQVVVVDHGVVVAEGTPEALTQSDADGRIRFALPVGADVADLAATLPPTVHLAQVPAEHGSRTDHTDLEITGPVDAELLVTLTTWCAGRGLMPEGLTVERRSLEDVFLEITGTELRA